MTLTNPMHIWFQYLWDQRQNEQGKIKCFECGKWMTRNTWRDISTCYSHILGRKKYPKYAGNSDNICIVHPDCHYLYTIKPSNAQNQFKLYLKLLEEINELD